MTGPCLYCEHLRGFLTNVCCFISMFLITIPCGPSARSQSGPGYRDHSSRHTGRRSPGHPAHGNVMLTILPPSPLSYWKNYIDLVFKLPGYRISPWPQSASAWWGRTAWWNSWNMKVVWYQKVDFFSSIYELKPSLPTTICSPYVSNKQKHPLKVSQ